MEHEERFYLMMMAALDDELAGAERAELETHLQGCPDCTREWRTLTAIETLFRQTPLLMPAVDFAERTLARLPNRRTRRMALGAIYGFLLLSGLVPLVMGLYLAARYAPILSQPELLGGIWASITGTGRAVATIIEALLTGAGALSSNNRPSSAGLLSLRVLYSCGAASFSDCSCNPWRQPHVTRYTGRRSIGNTTCKEQ